MPRPDDYIDDAGHRCCGWCGRDVDREPKTVLECGWCGADPADNWCAECNHDFAPTLDACPDCGAPVTDYEGVAQR